MKKHTKPARKVLCEFCKDEYCTPSETPFQCKLYVAGVGMVYPKRRP